jgi:hypothetical protein
MFAQQLAVVIEKGALFDDGNAAIFQRFIQAPRFQHDIAHGRRNDRRIGQGFLIVGEIQRDRRVIGALL